MSKEMLLAVWDRDLPHAEKSVLAAIAYNADIDGNNAWPSVGTVARRCGYSVRQVHNIITRLKRRNILIAQDRLGRRRGFVVVYSINLDAVPLLADDESVQSSQTMPDSVQGLQTIDDPMDGVTEPLPTQSMKSEAHSLQSGPHSMKSARDSMHTSAEEQYLEQYLEQEKKSSDFSDSSSSDQFQKRLRDFTKPHRYEGEPLTEEKARERRQALKAQAGEMAKRRYNARMSGTKECGIETANDGTKICSLHKKPLQEMSVFEEVTAGDNYPEINNSWVCPESQKVIIEPKW